MKKSAAPFADHDLGRISPRDTMIGASVEEYYRVGRQGFDHCQRTMGDRTPKRIIDFPSGHGRVMRWMRRAWPDAEI